LGLLHTVNPSNPAAACRLAGLPIHRPGSARGDVVFRVEGAILASHFSSKQHFTLDVLVGLMGYCGGHVDSSLGHARTSRLSA
jgi:hypothetical protein